MLNGTGKRLIPFFYILLVSISGLSAQALSLSAELEQEQIWLGDSVRLTLYLQGSENSISPDLVIPSVNVEKLGGTVRSSKSITNINGKVSEDVRKAYVFGYKLTPKKAGRIIIPSVEVNVEGRKLSTQQLVLTVMEPQKADGFELKLDFDRKKVYLNEACRLKVSFFYEKSLRSLEIRIPGLESLSFESAPGHDQ